MIRFLQGDCREVLKSLPDCSVQACITSPPYFGLRSYLRDGHEDKGKEIGLENTPDAFIAGMVEVFRELRRVLRDDGVAFLNLGDGYASQGGAHGGRDDNQTGVGAKRAHQEGFGDQSARTAPEGIKPKDLLLVPERIVLALQSDGWWVRSRMPWIKRSTMPESVDDRPGSAVEYVFMLTKSGSTTFWVHRDGKGTRTSPEPDYRWLDRDTDNRETAEEPDGWRTEVSKDDRKRKRWRRVNLWTGRDYFWDAEAVKKKGAIPAGTKGAKAPAERSAKGGVNSRPAEYAVYDGTRNFRNSDLFFDSLEPPYGLILDGDDLPIALDVNPQAFNESHFATFPPGLVEPLIKAATPEGGCCATCGAPWWRCVRDRVSANGRPSGNKERKIGSDWIPGASHVGRGIPWAPTVAGETVWHPTCDCPQAASVPATVLDPFSGAGTTALVSDRLQRNAIGIELNPDYIKMAERRIRRDGGLFADVAAE